MEQPETAGRLGIRIEKPPTEKMNFLYLFLLTVSFVFVGFTIWLLALEWTQTPLPPFLRQIVAF